MYEKLFEPVKINGMEVPNRLVFEPMGNYYAELNGDASQRDCDFYAARGAGGCGLVITEICSVNRTTGRGDARNLIIDNDEAIPSFRRIAAPAWTEELGVPVLVAGDSAGVGRIQEAVTGGYDAARAVK